MKYYMYRHIRPDLDVPFYIGIGTQFAYNREYDRAYSIKTRNRHWKGIVAKCSGFEVEIIYESDDHDEILNKEKEFIALYGRHDLGKGTLVNMTDGGEGSVGAKFPTRKKAPPRTEEHRRKIGEKSKNAVRTEEWCNNISKSRKGKKHSPETRAKMKLCKKGHKGSPDVLRRLAKERTGKPLPESTKEKMRKPKSEDHRRSMRMAWQIRKGNDPNQTILF